MRRYLWPHRAYNNINGSARPLKFVYSLPHFVPTSTIYLHARREYDINGFVVSSASWIMIAYTWVYFWWVTRAKAEYSSSFEISGFVLPFSPVRLVSHAFVFGWLAGVRADTWVCAQGVWWVRIIPSNTPLNCTKDSRIDYVWAFIYAFIRVVLFIRLFSSAKSVTHVFFCYFPFSSPSRSLSLYAWICFACAHSVAPYSPIRNK